jgi:hypothetical protein
LPFGVEHDRFLDLVWPESRRSTWKIVPSSMLLDGALINPELVSQDIDGHPFDVTLDQLLHPGCLKTPADTPWGSSFGRFGPGWDHFEEVPETFSMVRMVQVSSHYLHSFRFE